MPSSGRTPARGAHQRELGADDHPCAGPLALEVAEEGEDGLEGQGLLQEGEASGRELAPWPRGDEDAPDVGNRPRQPRRQLDAARGPEVVVDEGRIEAKEPQEPACILRRLGVQGLVPLRLEQVEEAFPMKPVIVNDEYSHALSPEVSRTCHPPLYNSWKRARTGWGKGKEATDKP
jgi:hypothetical protein